MSTVLNLWLFWVALVVVIAVAGAGPLIGGMWWALDRRESIALAGGVAAAFMLIYLPLIVGGVTVLFAPWAHVLGLEW